MKKCFLTFVLVLCCFLSVLSSSALAKQEVTTLPLNQTFYQSSKTVEKELGDYVDLTEFSQHVSRGISVCDNEIDLSAFQIPFSQSIAQKMAFYIWKEMPTAFSVNTISVSYFTETAMIANLKLTYYYSATQYQSMLLACENAASRLLEGLADNNLLSDVEKALLLHDRLALYCEYSAETQENAHDMYGALVNGLAVCEGYAKSYAFLLSKLGISSTFCASDALKHAWNIVSIDNHLYHVDVTWDDSSLGQLGAVSHENFLRSTQGMIATGHISDGVVDYITTPSGTEYDNAPWQTCESEVQLLDGNLYYIDAKEEKLCRLEESEKIELCSVADVWLSDSSHVWVGNFSKLTVFYGNLIFSQSDGIYLYRPSDNAVICLFRPNLSQPRFESVYGLSHDKDSIVFQIAVTPNIFADPASARTVKIGYLGDCNLDSDVTADDALYLLYHIAYGADQYPLLQACDFDQNKTHNNKDALYLLYHTVFGEALYPLNQK